MEITLISAQGLKNTSFSPFSHRLRPFITISTYPPMPCNGQSKCAAVYKTRVDDQGGVNPTWGDKFHIPIDTSFFANGHSCLYLQLFSKRLLSGQALLGWCQIPVTDIGFFPEGSVRYLTYRIRDRDGTRSHGTINLAIKLTGFRQPVISIPRLVDTDKASSSACQTVIGIPVTMFSHTNICQ